MRRNVIGGRGVGETQIFVSYLGLEVAVTVRVVDDDPVVAIAVVPSEVRVGIGRFTRVSFFAVRRSGTEFDITNDPRLFVAVLDPAIASYFGAGQVRGERAGQTGLFASFDGLATEVLVFVEDIDSQLVGLELTFPVRVGLGQTVPYTALAFFSDGTVRNVTGDPELTVSVLGPPIIDVGAGFLVGRQLGRTRDQRDLPQCLHHRARGSGRARRPDRSPRLFPTGAG